MDFINIYDCPDNDLVGLLRSSNNIHTHTLSVSDLQSIHTHNVVSWFLTSHKCICIHVCIYCTVLYRYSTGLFKSARIHTLHDLC